MTFCHFPDERIIPVVVEVLCFLGKKKELRLPLFAETKLILLKEF